MPTVVAIVVGAAQDDLTKYGGEGLVSSAGIPSELTATGACHCGATAVRLVGVEVLFHRSCGDLKSTTPRRGLKLGEIDLGVPDQAFDLGRNTRRDRRLEPPFSSFAFSTPIASS